MENGESKFNPILLLLIVVILAVTGLFLIFYPKLQIVTPPSSSPAVPGVTQNLPTPQPRILTTGEVNLTLAVSTQNIKVGQPFLLEVKIDPGAFSVSGVEAHLFYNPQILTITKIEPAGYFKNPEILIENNDQLRGSLDYAIASRNKATGTGTVFKITALAKAATNNLLEVPIEFSPNETKVGLSNPSTNERLGEAQTKVNFTHQTLTIGGI